MWADSGLEPGASGEARHLEAGDANAYVEWLNVFRNVHVCTDNVKCFFSRYFSK